MPDNVKYLSDYERKGRDSDAGDRDRCESAVVIILPVKRKIPQEFVHLYQEAT